MRLLRYGEAGKEKPGLLDAGGFWQPLLALVDHVIEQGFADPSLRGLFVAVSDIETLRQALRQHLPG